jgi:galactokinase
MTHQEDYLHTTHPNARVGVKMKRDRYDQISDFILNTLEGEKEMTINKLIEKGNYRFWEQLKDETGWYIYHVKLDMEARGLLHNERCEKQKKTFIVRSNPSRKRKSASLQAGSLRPERTVDQLAQNLRSKFVEVFSEEPLLAHSPGVINLVGEHTEFNNGLVIQAAIDRGVLFAFSKSTNGETVIYSMNEKQGYTVDTFEADGDHLPAWLKPFISALQQLRLKGHRFPGFHCMFYNDMPPNFNVGSCPATGAGFVLGLNILFDLKLSVLQMIRIAQLSKGGIELKCGIVDQFTSILGKENNVMMLDSQRLTHNYFPIDLKEYCLLICDSLIRNPHAETERDKRKAECDEGFAMLKKKYPAINSLKDLTIEKLIDSIELLPLNVLKRCQFIIQENERVQQAGKYLELCKLKTLGQIMYKSHDGLCKLYDVSCPEIDFLVEQTKEMQGVLGARLMGDVYGGRTLNIVHKGSVGLFSELLGSSYKKKFGLDLSTYVVSIGRGTSLLNSNQVFA